MGSSDSDSVFPSKEETGETNSELMWVALGSRVESIQSTPGLVSR